MSLSWNTSFYKQTNKQQEDVFKEKQKIAINFRLCYFLLFKQSKSKSKSTFYNY